VKGKPNSAAKFKIRKEMKMKIEIKTGNAAFYDCDAENEYADYYATAAELDRIFGQISRAVADGRTDGKVIDSNGNICGEWKI
jgi:hypothetical protein